MQFCELFLVIINKFPYFPGPKMSKVTTLTCGGYWDGTEDNVRLEFKNDLGETCGTDYLFFEGETEFQSGETNIWLGNALESCAGERWRPIGDLYFRWHKNTYLVNLHHDMFAFCGLKVNFGGPDAPGNSRWQWKGRSIGNETFGYYNSYSQWELMTKITE